MQGCQDISERALHPAKVLFRNRRKYSLLGTGTCSGGFSLSLLQRVVQLIVVGSVFVHNPFQISKAFINPFVAPNAEWAVLPNLFQCPYKQDKTYKRWITH